MGAEKGPRLPQGWAPPMPFKVIVEYRDPGRPADVLWTSPPLFQPKRGPVVFKAYGPARAPVSMGMLASVDFTGLPGGAIVLLATARDGYGQRVYSQPEHTLN